MAYETDGAVIDLSVGSQGIKARANRPIIIRDVEARIEEAYFARDAELKKFSQAMERRRPGTRWAPAEKIVKTDLRGLRLRFEIGPVWQQAALKMCLAGSKLLPAVSREDRIQAGKILRGPVIDPHPIVSQYFYRYPSVESFRPQLAHTLYVEHLGNTLRGIVQFFGTFQLYCELSGATQSSGSDAVLGWIDPIDPSERLQSVEPIGLSEPPASFDLIRAQLELAARFRHAAVQRGATPERPLLITLGLPPTG
jgi:hypothetical protein